MYHGFAYDTTYSLDLHIHREAVITYSVTPLLRLTTSRNINRVSIDYAAWPRLRTRLTHELIIIALEPLSFRRAGFSPAFIRYLRQHDHFQFVQPFFRSTFSLRWNARLPLFRARGFGTMLEPRYIFRAEPLDQ